MGILSWLFGCSQTEKNVSNLQEITSRFDPEEGWHDVFLKIVSTKSTDSTKIYVCKGLHKGKIVGPQVEVRTDIKAGISPTSEAIGFKKNAIRLSSIGKESDEFIRVLSELYGKTTTKSFIPNTYWLTVFSINQKPVDLDKKDYYHLKVFFDQNENTYSELFLNINTSKGEIELNEKDEAYREGVITHLTQ